MSTTTPGTARWDELVRACRARSGPDGNWLLGDAALEVGPHVAAFIDATGIDPVIVREYRRVAAAWPPDTRVVGAPWSHHRILADYPNTHPHLQPGMRNTVAVQSLIGLTPSSVRTTPTTEGDAMIANDTGRGIVATTVTLPTEAELRDTLRGIERLMTAKEWERAAIVWAFTTNDKGRPNGGGGKSREPVTFPVPISVFAQMGFHGLRTQETVARYRGIWQQAIDDGFAMPVHPGDLVNLPGAEVHPFPAFTAHHRYDVTDKDELREEAQKQDVGETMVLDMARNVKALGPALRGSAAVRAEALAVLTDLGLVPDVTDTPVDAAEANTAAALDEAAAKITALQRALDRVTAVNDRLAEDASATKAQRDAAREQLNIARTSLREERDTHATRVAELNRLRQDPDRIARAAAGAQYEWVLRGLHQATTALATVDNRLDTEQSVLTGEYQEAVLRTVDALSMRLTAIRSKLGGEWTTGPL